MLNKSLILDWFKCLLNLFKDPREPCFHPLCICLFTSRLDWGVACSSCQAVPVEVASPHQSLVSLCVSSNKPSRADMRSQPCFFAYFCLPAVTRGKSSPAGRSLPPLPLSQLLQTAVCLGDTHSWIVNMDLHSGESTRYVSVCVSPLSVSHNSKAMRASAIKCELVSPMFRHNRLTKCEI